MRALSLLPNTINSMLDLWDDDFFKLPAPAHRSPYKPSVDINETGDAYVLQADVPGLSKEDISVSVDNGVLTISGERKSEKKEEKDRYTYYERSLGKFERQFKLPDDVNAEAIEAKSTDGVLKLTIPKVEPKKARMIQIK